MTRANSMISSALLGMVTLALIPGCDKATSTPTEAVGASIPDHFFIAAERTTAGSLDCALTVELESWTEIWQRPLMPCTLDSGWGSPGTWGTWVTNDRAGVTFDLPTTDWNRISVLLKAYEGLPVGIDQTMTIELNGRAIGQSAVKRSWENRSFDLPAGLLRVGSNSVSLVFGHRASPVEVGKGKDRRRLAASVQSIRLTRSTWRFSRAREPAPTQVFDAKTRRFFLDRPGTLVVPIELTAGATHLKVDVELPTGVDRDQTRIAATVTPLDGRSAQTANLGDDTNPWLVPLELDAVGETALVNFEVDSPDMGTGIAISIPRPTTAGGEQPAAAPAVDTDRSAQTPDIVLIILDAARADHFSCYGYGRLTAPVIDQVAATSLVFRRAFAMAPYTLNSVPTMITGLSFFDHGVTSRKHSLSMEFATLAEYLSVAGYATVAFSAMPNNSIARGLDQGYDHFFELWKGKPRPPNRDPHFVTDRVVDWLDSADVSRPLHLQVHLVPPHAPYVPNPRFDVFSNAGYEGPCDGSVQAIKDLESGLLAPDGGCLDHLLDRYDDNLLAVDDAVGQLLVALSRRPRWRDTVLLITSDHGEAFHEHGQMEHSSPVYDEMSHVPFILKTPSWIDTSAADTDRLVTLADILPTLLATAGLQPVTPHEGVDLLDPATAPFPTDSRYFVATATNKPPILGLRTRRWKVMLTASGHGALMDLDNDPGETRNLRFDNPALFAGLGLLLTGRASEPPAVTSTVESAEITDDDREMLEALGYVE